MRQIFQIARELRLLLCRIERLPLRDVSLGERIENKNIRRAAFGLRIHVQFGDELRVESGGAAAFDVERKPFRPLRRERELERAAERLPVALARILPAAKPLQPVGDVADFIAIDFFHA